LQRLFSTFPDGWPGRGLFLVLRLGVGISLVYFGIGDLLGGFGESMTAARDLLVVAGGILLLAGLWTPVAGVLTAIEQVWLAFSRPFSHPSTTITHEETEKRFQNMADSAMVMIWVTDADKQATSFNKPCLEFTGHTLEEKRGDGWIAAIHPEDRECFLGVFSSSIDARKEFRSVFRLLRANGEYRWVLCTGVPRFAGDGAFSGYIGSCIDITEQKLIQERLLDSEARLKNAARLARIGYWQLDIKSNQVIWSEESFRIFGRPPDYTPSYEGFLETILSWDREGVDRAVRHSLAKKCGHSIEFQIDRPDGVRRTITNISEVLLDEEGEVSGLFGTCQDITDVKRAQKELFARQKLESVGTLAGGIAHDFNNLLGGVMAQAELALGELAAGSRPEEELKTIRNAAIRGAEIVRQLMIYSGKESGTLELVNVSRTVTEMIELLGASISKRAKLQVDLEEDLPALWGNAPQLRQIVMNLVTNASEAIGDRDGVIRVSTRCVNKGQESQATTDRWAQSSYLQLEVSDNGCGMSQETQARIFDPFFTTKSAGHGLGLAVVDGIVRDLGGVIHLTSKLDKGTTFQVLLPCTATSTAISNLKLGAFGSALFQEFTSPNETPSARDLGSSCGMTPINS
jgi:PAS domain S-box-containing protein